MSIVSIQVGEKTFNVDSDKGFDLSIPYRFQGERLNAFGVNPTSLQTVENNIFLGDSHRNGSCNVNQYTLIPHCHGTHTECIGHIVNDEISILETIKDVWIPCLILTVNPVKANASQDRYASNVSTDDMVITKDHLTRGLGIYSDEKFQQAIIIRTLPNDDSKKIRQYSTAPYFTNNAMEVIANHPVNHLLVDLPSVDRMDDQGKLSNHRIFWGMVSDSFQAEIPVFSNKTITELVFVANDIKDGYYLLNLQISPLMADAAPSRPLVFSEQEL